MAHWRPLINWSSPSSNNSFRTPSPPLCSTGARGFLTTTTTRQRQHAAKDAVQPTPLWRFSAHTIFDPKIDIDLVQDIAHAHGGGVCQHDKPQVGRCLVVVHTVLAGAVADEGIVFATQLSYDVAQTKDGTEDELGIIGGAGDLF